MSSTGNSAVFRSSASSEKRNVRRDSYHVPLVESTTGSSSQSSYPKLPQHLSQENMNDFFSGNTESGVILTSTHDSNALSFSSSNRVKNNFRHSLDNSSFTHIRNSTSRRNNIIKNVYPEQHLSNQSMQVVNEITPDSDCSIKSDNHRIHPRRDFHNKNNIKGNIMEIRQAHTDKEKQIFDDPNQIFNTLDIPSPERRRKLLQKKIETNSSYNTSEIILSQERKPSFHESASVISDSSSVRYSNARKAMVQKIFRIAQQTEQVQTQVQASIGSFTSNVERSNVVKNTENNPNQDSAVTFARTAPKAGYLYKLGANVQTYKRRFFILKPTTHFYYFLSPNDSEPRGCIDLESSCSTIREIETLPDGRFRFEIVGNTGNLDSIEQRIILEARNEEVGRDWITKLKEERLSFYKTKCDDHAQKEQEYEKRICELEKQIQNFRLVEQDRDGAIQDAEKWKGRFNSLNDALHLLTRQIKKAHVEPKTSESNENEGNEITSDSKNEVDKSNKKEANQAPSKVDISTILNISEEELQIEDLDLNGTHFSSLNNACQMLKENLRLTSLEATTSVEEVHRANEKFSTQQKRMKKAEKLICKLWEENCALRDVAKQKKKECRFLGQQIRMLMGSNPSSINELPDISPASTATTTIEPKQEVSEKRKKMVFGLKEKMLLQELEDHVVSSLKLHEKLLNANRTGYRRNKKSVSKSGLSTSLNANLANPVEVHKQISYGNKTVDKQFESNQYETEFNNNIYVKNESDYDGDLNESFSPIKPSRLTFAKNIHLDETTSITSDISNSVPGQVSKKRHDGDDGESVDLSINLGSTISKETHPLFRLGQDDWTDDNNMPPNLCSSSSQSVSHASRSTIAENGKATSYLACPLADVIHKQESTLRGVGDDGMVYHLTFYCKKIGLQFQKVPNEAPSSGLLKEALTTDNSNDNGKYQGRTALELNTISMISNRTNNTEVTCPVATPVDAVLVCGFYGFDAASNQQRPKLGARLVAFDGVSVEIGKWTFEAIRKAIQARGRPITLSFRNDYLTPKQRGILAKAINDVGSHPPLPPPSYVSHSRYASSRNVGSNKINEKNQNQRTLHGSSPESFSSISESHHIGRITPASKTDLISPQTWQSERSFSDAGNSSIISSAFGPLVAGLMARGSGDKRDKPNYLQVSNSLDDIVEHQDFKASLL